MRRFNGVATKYLDSYLGWRRLIEGIGENLTSLAVIAAALPNPQRETRTEPSVQLPPVVFGQIGQYVILGFFSSAA